MVFISAIVVKTSESICLRKMKRWYTRPPGISAPIMGRACHSRAAPSLRQTIHPLIVLTNRWPTLHRRWPQSSPNRMQATEPYRGLDQPKAEPVTRALHTGRMPCALVWDWVSRLVIRRHNDLTNSSPPPLSNLFPVLTPKPRNILHVFVPTARLHLCPSRQVWQWIRMNRRKTTFVSLLTFREKM